MPRLDPRHRRRSGPRRSLNKSTDESAERTVDFLDDFSSPDYTRLQVTLAAAYFGVNDRRWESNDVGDSFGVGGGDFGVGDALDRSRVAEIRGCAPAG